MTLDLAYHQTLAHLEAQLRCALIATPLVSTDIQPVDTPAETLIAAAVAERYDWLPLRAAGATDAVTHLARVDRQSRRLAIAPLEPGHRIDGDAPIDAALARLLEVGCLLVDRPDGGLGILTAADFNRLPVRLYVFTLLSHFEVLLQEVITRSLPGGAWEAFPYKDSVEKAKTIHTGLRADNMDLDVLHCTTLFDKLRVLEGAPGFAERFPTLPWAQLDDFVHGSNRLRNGVMHGRPFVVATRGRFGRRPGMVDLPTLGWLLEHLRGAIDAFAAGLRGEARPPSPVG